MIGCIQGGGGADIDKGQAFKGHSLGSGSVGPAWGGEGTDKPRQVWQVLAKRLLLAKPPPWVVGPSW